MIARLKRMAHQWDHGQNGGEHQADVVAGEDEDAAAFAARAVENN